MNLVDSLLLDLKYAFRALVSRPGFSALAILTLALGIGVNTVAFNTLNALLFKSSSMPGAESLGWVLGRGARSNYESVSLPDYQYFARHNQSFETIAAEGRLAFSLQRDGSTEQAWGLVVSTDYLPMLRVRPELGRLFTTEDLQASELSAVVSHRFWVDRLEGGDSIAGRTVVLNGRSVSVVGVLPDGFQGPGGLYEPDIWVPLERLAALNVRADLLTGKDAWLTMIGRLEPGITAAQAQADLDNLSARLTANLPETEEKRRVWFASMQEGHPEVRGLAPVMWIALAIVGLVLLIACFNVASLLLARASERQREIGVRSALGASRTRVFRQLIVEATLLALASGVASLIVAAWSADLLSTFSVPASVPQRLHMGLDLRLVGFVTAMVAAAGVFPALVPAIQATRTDLLQALRTGTAAAGTRSRARSSFVIAQIAGSTLFLAAALLFVRSHWNGANTDPGFETKQVLVFELTPATYGYDNARARVLLEELLERVRRLPAVTSAALADRVPFYVGFPRELEILADDSGCSDPACRAAELYEVGPQHFTALGARLVAGRDFNGDDVATGPAVVISEFLARRLWPGRQAVGEWLRVNPGSQHLQVIGVVANITHRGFNEPLQSYIYRPLPADGFDRRMTMLARVTGEPTASIGSIQAQLHALDPGIPMAAIDTMEGRMEMPLWPSRTLAGFFLICGVLAMTLATVGLFGVTYYAVSQRTREFGIRVALGATRKMVMRLVLRDALALALPGILIGICGVLAAGRLLASALLGVSPYDPLTLAAAAVLQVAVALLACALPARRATAADPMRALRQE